MDPFASMYLTNDRDRELFGSHWTGPDRLARHEVEVARYPKDPPDGDGREVVIYCEALPARFYTVKALPSVNSVGRTSPGFILTTGSGSDMGRWAAETAALIARGMVGVPSTDEEG